MRARITTALEVLGLAVVAAGVALMWVPAGVVAAGVALVVIGAAEGRKS